MVAESHAFERPKPIGIVGKRRSLGADTTVDLRSRPLNSPHRRALIVDLNNFSTFPTLAVGLLVAALRNAGAEARVICPLAYGVVAVERERRETFADQIARRIHHTTWRPLRKVRDQARRLRAWWQARPDERVFRELAQALAEAPDVVLLSAYLQHYATVARIGRMAAERGIPVILGGPVFNIADTAEAWRRIPGLAAIVGGEVDLALPEIVEAACGGEDLLRFEGVLLPDGRRSRPAAPLRKLDRIPVPDFTDFPWDRYRFRVVPVMTGRGCQWNRCSFCSDIVSASGRTFRTRSLDAVMVELREQARRHDTRNFLFLDLKLNSNPAMFRGITEEIQRHVPGAQWIGTVHVDRRADSGLAPDELRAAARSGMRRISFGLESGSQRLLDAMDKGASVEANAAFIRSAHEAGLSVRCTMFKGYPGETAEDLEATADFLEVHARYLDRIRYNDFSIHEGTPIYAALRDHPEAYPAMRILDYDHRNGRALYDNAALGGPAYRRANARVMALVHAVNRKRLRQAADAFDGLM